MHVEQPIFCLATSVNPQKEKHPQYSQFANKYFH